MKLSDIAAGTRAIRRVPLSLVNVSSPLVPEPQELAAQRAIDVSEGLPREIEVGLRVLTGAETADVFSRARAYCLRNGLTEPKESEPLYNLAVSVYKLALSCVDPDSDPKVPTLFFADDGRNVEQAAETIFTSPHVGRDGIAYLDEQQELWQDQCNPQALKVSSDQLFVMVEEVARDADFLRSLRPGLRVILAHFMANLLTNSPADKSHSGERSEPTIGKSTSNSES